MPGTADAERPIRVLVVDDHPVVRRGLVALLGSLQGFEVAAESADGESAIREVLLVRPDVVLMDMRMPGISGVETTRRLAVKAPGVPVLMLTMYDDDATVFTAMQVGARGTYSRAPNRTRSSAPSVRSWPERRSSVPALPRECCATSAPRTVGHSRTTSFAS